MTVFSSLHHFLANDITSVFFRTEWRSTVPHVLIQSPVDVHPGWFHTVAIVSGAKVSTGVHGFHDELVLSGTAGLYRTSIRSMLRKLHSDFHSGSV